MQNDEVSDTAPRDAPVPPIKPTSLLRPITSWKEMHDETRATGVEFDATWYECVIQGSPPELKPRGSMPHVPPGRIGSGYR